MTRINVKDTRTCKPTCPEPEMDLFIENDGVRLRSSNLITLVHIDTRKGTVYFTDGREFDSKQILRKDGSYGNQYNIVESSDC